MRMLSHRGETLLAGIAFAVLVIAGNALQGGTPALHGDAEAVVDFYTDKPTRIAIAMSLSLLSLFFLAWFLAALASAFDGLDDVHRLARRAATGASAALVALLAAGFALNAAGALRAGEAGISPESAVVFYDGSLALTGLAAPLTMAVLLAATARVVLRSRTLPRWFGMLSAALAVLGIVTPLSFVLSLLFPLWVVAAAIVMARSVPNGRAAAPEL
jgi:hypothetical protein